MSFAKFAQVALLLLVGLAEVKSLSAQTFTVLYTFTGGTDGGFPNGGLIQDSAGNLYGTTGYGGRFKNGTIFKLNHNGRFKVLHSFGAGGAGGATPSAGLARDSAGTLYGVTAAGGASNQGTVFKLPKRGKFTLLYSFSGGLDGSTPAAPLIFDPAGNLYGTTYLGGSPNCNAYRYTDCGTVFELNTTGHEKVLHRFSSQRKNGDFPSGGLLRGATGNLYGTTYLGGPVGYGTVFKLDPTGHETILHAFQNSDGALPTSGLIQDAAGNLYGTTASGNGFFGAIFKLDPQSNETVLHAFTDVNDGTVPIGNLIMDSAGNFYGTTYAGGKNNGTGCYGGEGCGVVFKLDPSGQETMLYSFGGGTDGWSPRGGLVMDAAGNLYGTTGLGGTHSNVCPGGCGVVFKIAP
jgi:uncharacterized repeat protein (TIGR03803 family)